MSHYAAHLLTMESGLSIARAPPLELGLPNLVVSDSFNRQPNVGVCRNALVEWWGEASQALLIRKLPICARSDSSSSLKCIRKVSASAQQGDLGEASSAHSLDTTNIVRRVRIANSTWRSVQNYVCIENRNVIEQRRIVKSWGLFCHHYLCQASIFS